MKRIGGTDWHPEDIKAAVRKTGITLSDLSRAHNLPSHACRNALQGPYFDAELVIAERLGKSPREIWPSRFGPDGTRRHRIQRHAKTTTAPRQNHDQVKGTA